MRWRLLFDLLFDSQEQACHRRHGVGNNPQGVSNSVLDTLIESHVLSEFFVSLARKVEFVGHCPTPPEAVMCSNAQLTWRRSGAQRHKLPPGNRLALPCLGGVPKSPDVEGPSNIALRRAYKRGKDLMSRAELLQLMAAQIFAGMASQPIGPAKDKVMIESRDRRQGPQRRSRMW